MGSMGIVMLYPFMPWGWHGGTLRLRTATTACEGEHVDVRWWDAAARTWRGSLDPAAIGGEPPTGRATVASTRISRLKRTLFPSTLWESGRRAVAAAEPLLRSLNLSDRDTVILHTTYLAPLIPLLSASGARVVVDVHDLVWRAHRVDATGASAPLWAVRGAYALAVRRREERLLAAADRLLVAGYRDFENLQKLGPRARWVPTGLDARPTTCPSMPPVRLGLIGNFAHSATVDAARRLADSGLGGKDGGVRLVFAGLGSQAWRGHAAIDVLGPVRDVEEFYRRINLALVPVASGSGMKCKLAEAALAGKAVITTASGASGYPPHLRRQFHVYADPLGLSPADIAAIAQAHDPTRSHAIFDREVGLAAAAKTYRDALA